MISWANRWGKGRTPNWSSTFAISIAPWRWGIIMRAKSASALPSRKTSRIAFMVSAKAASTASTGELDFSHKLNKLIVALR